MSAVAGRGASGARTGDSAILVADICGFWVTGTGAGRGYRVDRAGARDADDLPYLPGRHVRGLLREAVRQAVRLGLLRRCGAPWPDDAEDVLFGTRGRTGPYPDLAGRVSAGALETRDLRLPEDVREALRGPERADARATLVRHLHQTAMHETLHVARDASLRTTEAVLPMRLRGEVGLRPGAREAAEDLPEAARALVLAWRDTLEDVFCLVDAVGAGRMHGLGRALLSWDDAAARCPERARR